MQDYIDKHSIIMKEYNDFKNNLIVNNIITTTAPHSVNGTPSPTRGMQMCYNSEIFQDLDNVKTFYNLTKMNQNSPSNPINFF